MLTSTKRILAVAATGVLALGGVAAVATPAAASVKVLCESDADTFTCDMNIPASDEVWTVGTHLPQWDGSSYIVDTCTGTYSLSVQFIDGGGQQETINIGPRPCFAQ
jgi:hypothetical protein